MSITIESYNPEWPKRFEDEQKSLRLALKNWNVAIEHIGSTAVPGLGAKPVIDILMGVTTLTEVNDSFIAILKSLGYEYVPEYEKELPERRYFRKNSVQGVRTFQIHIAVKDGPFWQRHIAFRDYLRTHPQAAQEYEQLKRKLAPMHTDTQEYAHAKTKFIQSIHNRINRKN